MISVQGMINGRGAIVYVPELQVKQEGKKDILLDVMKNPFPVFKERVEKDYLKFLHTSKEFLSCMNERKWPEERECLKHINICFNVPRTPTNRYEKCDVWRAEDFQKVCDYRSKNIDLAYCLKNEEKALKFLADCFYSQNTVSFRYIAKDSASSSLDWNEDLFMFVSSANIPPYEVDFSCVFTHSKGRFNLIEIRGVYFGEGPLEFVLPPESYIKSN